MPQKGIGFWLGFFLVSAAVLFLEILTTRIFSLILWNNMAYLVISMAMLGIGSAGVWDLLLRKDKKESHLACLSLAAAVAVFISLRVVGLFDFQLGLSGILVLAAVSLLIFLPFFFMGLVLVRVFSARAEKIGAVYAINLLASACGVVLGLGLLGRMGMPDALVAACLCLALAALLFSAKETIAVKAAAAFCILFMATGFFWSEKWFKLKVTSTKTFKFQKLWPDFNLEFSKWDPLGRVDVFSSGRSWLVFDREKYFYRVLIIDGAADTTIIDFRDLQDKTGFFKGTVYGQAFTLLGRPPEKVLVIGVGGGPDVQAALAAKSKEVTGVEVNRSVLKAVRKFSPGLANDPRVRLVASDGRSYVARSKDKFDIIQISGVDTVSALEWGAYIQAENYVHTVEAYIDYFKHLSPDGVLSLSLVEMAPPRNMLRSSVLAVEAMRRMGIDHPEQKIILVQQSQFLVMLVRLRPFTADEIRKFQSDLESSQIKGPILFEIRYLLNEHYPLGVRYAPGVEKPDDAFTQFFAAVAKGNEAGFIKDYPFDISAVSDNRPFFYKFYYWPYLSFAKGGLAGPVLWVQLLLALSFATVFIILPVLLKRGQKSGGIFLRVWFFFFIGLGYMMVEIPLIQEYALYLGHPVYALGLVLGALLVSSGIGAWLFQKILFDRTWAAIAAVAAVIIINLIGLLFLGRLLGATMDSSFAVRVLVAGLCTGLLGLFMGVPFPAGLRRLEQSRPGLVPWAWAVNSSASVVSSVLAVIVAMGMGFRWISLLACFCYFLAGAAFFLVGRD
jgi:spermidine synthase